ncbi:DUF773 domain-containing protein [Leptospira kmetyi]|uniref:DUF773 domain-containing protein n=1 Tax=Leptospira kmetyi TaxID=408139 RepID=UPI000C2B01A4|nr:DUF773 domain-containing protein [Leptospira kmetyi]PJZ40091.1 DUF773 domain-containing protein [Leptospira kmetyi]
MSLFLFETFTDNFQTKHKEVAPGKWFGLNTLNLDGKPFAAFFEGELVLKLGAEKIAEIFDRYPGAKLFDPSKNNRAMKDWLQIPVEFQEDWDSLGESALILAQKAAKAGTPARKKAAPKKAAKKKAPAKKKSAAKKKAKPKKSSAKKAKAKVKPKKKAPAKKKVAKKKTAAKKRRR